VFGRLIVTSLGFFFLRWTVVTSSTLINLFLLACLKSRNSWRNVEAHLNPKEGGPFLEAVAPHLGSGHRAWGTAQRRQKEVRPVMKNRKKYCPLELQDWLNAPGNAALKIKTSRKCQDQGICARCVHVTPGNKSAMPTPTMSSSSSSSSLLKKREQHRQPAKPLLFVKQQRLDPHQSRSQRCGSCRGRFAAWLAHLLWREQLRINSKQLRINSKQV
jgi:hypothetical protein